MVRLILRIVASRLRRKADTIDLAHPGPHVPETLGHEWSRLAANLRKLADEIEA